MYIISYKCELEKQNDYEIIIERPEDMADFFAGAQFVRHQRYRIEYTERDHEVLCPRYKLADGTDVTVIPWFLIPGRPYPLQVYLHACNLYSTKPGIGQRGAAEATRKKFNLDTFSHSTVSRSFRAFERAREQALERRFGKEAGPGGGKAPVLVEAAPKAGAKGGPAPRPTGRFPRAADTAERRGELAVFLAAFACREKKGRIEAAGREFARNWHEKSRRLLL